MLFSRQRHTGIALCGDHITLACLSRKHGQPRLEHYAAAPLPTDCCTAGKLLQTEPIALTLRQLSEEAHVQHWPASLALSAIYTMRKLIRLPSELSDAERETLLTENLPHYFPDVTDPVQLDFATHTQGEHEDEVLASIARTADIEKFTSLAITAGIRLCAIDIDAYAKQQAMAFSSAHPAPYPHFFLECYTDSMQLTIIHANQTLSLHKLDSLTVSSLQHYLHAFSTPPHTLLKLWLSGNPQQCLRLHAALSDTPTILATILNPFPHQEKLTAPSPLLGTAVGTALRWLA